MNESLPCIICGRPLKGVFKHDLEDEIPQPAGAVSCRTNGNFGSTVYDPIGSEYLLFNICDACLVKLGDRGLIRLIKPSPVPRPLLTVLVWNSQYDPYTKDDS